MKFKQNNWLTRSVFLVAAYLLPWFTAYANQPAVLEKLTVAHAYHASFSLLYVADQAGLFQQEGLEVQFKRYSFGRDALKATLEGNADIATPYDTPVALAILKDEPVRVLSSLSVLTNNSQVLCNKRKGIYTAADLKGHRIGFLQNTISEYVLSMVLFDAGIDEKQVVRVPQNNPEELRQAFLRGDLDAVALWPPYTRMIAEAMGIEKTVKFTSPAYIESALLTTTDVTLQQKGRAIKKFMTALIKAQDLLLHDPARALHYTQNALSETPPDIVAETWSFMQPQIRLDNRLQASLKNQISWFQKRLHQETVYSPDVRINIADGILRSIQPQAVTIKELR